MNFDEAKAVNHHLEAIVMHANEVLFVANNSEDEKLKAAVKSSLGNAIASIDIDVWELVYIQYPELRPPEMIDLQGGENNEG